jgi:uncharacterized damage-inducible protein DinB
MDIEKLIQYNTWANRLIIEQVETFPSELFDKHVGGSFGSIKALMTHLLESDYLWLYRWKGTPLADLPAWQHTDLRSMKNTWYPIQDEMVELSNKISPTESIKFITRKGAPFTLPFGEIAVHVSHHGSYHRGQLTNMIRDLGQKPVSTDYFLFYTKK